MDKTYQPSQIEQRHYQRWEQAGYFQPKGEGEPFCIMIPPPNVTGTLHMGHGFQESIMDALIRHQRMLGKNTLWQVGTDHAGIATQMVVERQLAEDNITRHDLGRDKFIEKVWEWKEQSGGAITQQLRRLGASPDWSRERFTMDEGFSNAVQEVFIRLHEEGLIYRGQRLVNWDPTLHTAISDLEVLSEEEQGHMWHFDYPLSDGSGVLTVATTRPETMLGDSAVAVSPDDERYAHLVGKTIRLPLVDRDIPIIADDYVDKEFGTGCVKITPAHDFNDYEVGKRHDLPLINILTEDATINDTAPEAYRGMDRYAARKQIVADFDSLGLLRKVEEHSLKVPRGDRSGVVIEPYLTYQWYVAAEKLAQPAIDAVENGSIEFVPKQYENMYFSWMRDIQDWCISRQLWWGHRIPAWYDAEGNIYVGESEKAVREKFKLPAELTLTQDQDVLDTWFSSALWTFGTLGWPAQTKELETFHPTNVLVTGFDIIFFWVARMIMMTLHLKKEIPFKTVYVHGLVRDGQGQKMSKSKGNVLDPIDLIDGIELEPLIEKRTSGLMQPKQRAKIEKQTRKEFPEGIASYGTDALRFTYYSLASTGRNINFDVGRIEGFRNFCNKLWNASNYVLMNVEGKFDTKAPFTLSAVDKWIVSRLQGVKGAVDEGMRTYRLDLASQALYDFIWKDYCDWYLELTKPTLWNDDAPAEQQAGARLTLIKVLEAVLRLSHPFMPFISEEIWLRVSAVLGNTDADRSICQSAYPLADATKVDRQAETEVDWMKSVVTGVRNIRGEMNIAPKVSLPLVIVNKAPRTSLEATLLDNQSFNSQLISKLANCSTISACEEKETLGLTASFIVDQTEFHIPMADFIDKDAEIARLNKELARQSGELKKVEGKLANAKFIERAPEDVVEKEKERARDLSQTIEKLNAQLATLSAL